MVPTKIKKSGFPVSELKFRKLSSHFQTIEAAAADCFRVQRPRKDLIQINLTAALSRLMKLVVMCQA